MSSKITAYTFAAYLDDLIARRDIYTLSKMRAALQEAESAARACADRARAHHIGTKLVEEMRRYLDDSGMMINVGESDFDEYQNRCHSFVTKEVAALGISYFALGLGGEAGEVLEKIKKILRDGIISIVGLPTKMMRSEVKDLEKELGDVLWYLSMIASTLGLRLSEVASTNIAKLESRKERDVLHGEGDDR